MEVIVNCLYMDGRELRQEDLKQELDDLGVTQVEFSKFTGIPTSTLARVFGGEACRRSTIGKVRRGIKELKEQQAASVRLPREAVS
jgi:predicted transcriptional regulator